MKSHFTHLQCTWCQREFPHEKPIRTCPDCGRVLFARYDLDAMGKTTSPDDFIDRPSNMWRFFEMMPVIDTDNLVTLGEGGTPLMRANNLGKTLGLENLYIKDEGLNPTGSFKARGLSAAVSKAKEVGEMRVTMPTAGNAGGALAAYAAKAGMEATVFMPQDAPLANQLECRALGARLFLIEGLINDAGRMSQAKAAEEGLFDLSTLREPYRAEGKKTMALELAMDLGWRAPDVIVYPTGGGTGIVGMHKAFKELQDLGWIDTPQPKFICIQAEGCQPLVKAFHEGEDSAEEYPNASTDAAGLRVPAVFADYIILKVLRETGGTAIAVTDKEMVDAMTEMGATEGVFAAPEGAATLVGLKKLIDQNFLTGSETVILMNTGSGYKYMDLL
jgi:threonine synthase